VDPGTLMVAAEVLALLGLGAALAVVWRLVRRDRGRDPSCGREGEGPGRRQGEG